VKIRGFRIELGEIEARIAEHAGVQEIVVIAREDVRGEPRLVAYVVPVRDAPADLAAALRTRLAAQLPGYMVPAAFVTLDALPLSAHGKLDRKALPAPDSDAFAHRHYEPPHGEIEIALAELWRDLLGVERIGRHDHFFELGGHSLIAVRLLSRLGQVFALDGLPLTTVFKRPDLAGLAEAIATHRSASPSKGLPPIVARAPTDLSPLSFAQQRLWFLAQFDNASSRYHIPLLLRLHGQLDTDALARSLDRLFARHEALRTIFRAINGQPQVMLLPADAGLPLLEHDLRNVADATEALARLTAEAIQRPFDLATGPLIRASLMRVGEHEHVFVLTLHHIASDGWSSDLLARELSTLYTAFCRDQPDPLPPLPIQYPDYAVWQRQWLTAKHLRPHVEYWRRTLADAPTLLALPTDRPRPPQQSFAGAMLPIRLEPRLAHGLKRLSQQHGSSVFMTVMAAWAVVLARLSGQDDLVIGTASANRGQRETHALIGFFVSTLALRIDLSGEPSVADLLQRVRDAALGAQEHQDLPFEQVVEAVQPERRLDHTPLFQVLFAWQSNDEGRFELPGLRVESSDAASDVIRFDLELHLHEADGTIEGLLSYATALFDAATIERQRGYLIAVLQAMVADAQRPVTQIELLDTTERNLLLAEWNHTEQPYPSELCIHQLFEQQVQQCPHAIALIHGKQSLSYAELDLRANRLAHHLIGLGVTPGDRIALCVERSPIMLIGLLAILKTGSAYVPLDPSYPTERLNQIVGDAAPSFVLCDAQGRAALGEETAAGLRLLALEASPRGWDELPADAPDAQRLGLHPDHLAYVIYTSGSTGTPKGVAMAHRPLVNLITWQIAQSRAAGLDQPSTLQFAALGFDVAFQEIFSTLCAGATLVLIDAQTRLHFGSLLDTVRTQQVQRLFLPYIAAQSLAEAVDALDENPARLPQALRQVIVAGEQLRLTPQLKRFFQKLPACSLHNHYGPTETHVVTTFQLDAAAIQRSPSHVPIGRPIANTRTYLLDAQQQPVPLGAVGELYIGGVALAQGYLHRSELTAERFLADPFNPQPNARMYRTGDLARYLPDGDLVFLGRNDQQVKIRGFRIELGEIEAALAEHAQVREAAVLAREDSPGVIRLVAYVVPETAEPAREDLTGNLREHLSERLPEYMVPSAFVTLDSFPSTSHGKLDRRALPVPDDEAFVRQTYVAPQGETERTLARLWQELLGVERVGREDDFFALGGHSLIAVRLISRLAQMFGSELSLGTLFAHPILHRLAHALDAAQTDAGAATSTPIPRLQREGPLALSYAQQRLWFLAQLDSVSATYHLPFALRLRGELDSDALRRSLDRLFARHEGLRSIFVAEHGQPHVELLPSTHPLPMLTHDLRRNADPASAQTQLIAEVMDADFDLERGPLIRALLLRLDEHEYIFVLNQHHIVSDGWSLGVLMHELNVLYAAFSEGRPDPLPPLSVQYPDYAAWQREWLSGERLQVQTDYWRRTLADAPSVLSLPTDRPRPPQQSFAAAFLPVTLDPELSLRLKRLSQHNGSTLFITMLAAWALVLARLAGVDDLVIGTPTAARGRREIEPLIGFFVNTLALRIDLSGEPSVADLLAQVRQIALDAQAHQDLPFEQVVDVVQPERRLDHTPLFQVLFAWQSNEETSLQLPGVQVEPVAHPFDWAKFDVELIFREVGDTIQGGFNYSTALFDAATIERQRDYLITALEAMVADAQQPIARIDLLGDDERTRLLHMFNATDAPCPRSPCLHQLFEQHARDQPDRIALVHAGQSLSYAELNRQANQLAHHLIEQNLRADDRVALCVERGFAMLVGVLAILKSGAAYVPFDPAYSSARLGQILADAAPRVLLADAVGAAALGAQAIASMTLVDIEQPARWANRPSHNPDLAGLAPHHLAYVIYTSGSTGTPKGVMVEHRNAVHLVSAQMRRFEVCADSRISQFASIGFDASVLEIMMALGVGAALYLPTPAERQSASAFIAWLDEHAITHTVLPPAFLQNPAALPQLTRSPTVIFGGESPAPALLRCWSTQARVVNAYGPTEATVCASAWDLPAGFDECDIVAIGRPLANTRLYLLDAHGQPVPLGATGELYIGGAGVARGYLHRPELTAERFLDDPFSPHPGARMYRSGDLARYLPDGNLVFLGRNDHQVKIRGYRIELGEIEARIAEHAGVQEAVVLAREDVPGEYRLVAYVVPTHDAPADLAAVLRTQLATQLPDYMLPAAFVTLDALPLTAHGKLDRKALPVPGDDAFAHRSYAAPQDEIEILLAELWHELLGVQRVGRHDHFFELGGHSLIAVQLVARLRQLLGIEVAVRTVFLYPVLAELAEQVRPNGSASSRGLRLDTEPSLDPAIRAQPDSVRPAALDHVLLTGATGFLGAFLLGSLLEQTRATIHCLIRCDDEEQGRRRLQDNLRQLGLEQICDSARVVIVPGDLTKPKLGLTPAQFDALAQTIDVIYHNGAWVNSLHTYATLKAANVLGTQETLRLACAGKLKHVHYISTLSTVPPIETVTGKVTTEEELFEHWQGLASGYAQSKWVAEKILHIAGRRGIPFTIYRPTHISASSSNGASNAVDTWSLFIDACFELGCAPELDAVINSLPVDYIGDSIVNLSLRDDVDGRSLNLSNPEDLALDEFIQCMVEMDLTPIRRVPYREWLARCVENPSTRNIASVLSADITDESNVSADPPPPIKLGNAVEQLTARGDPPPPITREFLQCYLRWRYLQRRRAISWMR
jgi:amino acid adenylation domain-containing protein/thioester reductase-like protein